MSNDNTGCTIEFFKKNPTSCSSNPSNTKPLIIKPIVIKAEGKREPSSEKIMRNILKDVTNYKKRSENKTKKLLEELKNLKKEFKQFKTKTNNKITQVNSELSITQKKLSTQKKKLVKTQKKVKHAYTQLKFTTKELSKEKVKIKIKSLAQETVSSQNVIQTIITHQPIIPITNNLPWVEIVVEDGINLKQLALKYYGSSEEYLTIYAANQDIIAKNFQLMDGMSLKIPIIGNFQEQPMVLNRY